MKNLSIDIETYSSVSLKEAGMYAYAESKDFEILLFAYSVDFREVEIVDLTCGESIPENIIDALNNPSIIKHAYNAPFEITCLSRFYEVDISSWRCTMFHGLYLGYPMGLAKIGEAVGLPKDKQKLSVGSALIKYFCVPCKPTKSNGGRTRNLPNHDAEKWESFKKYCIQDVVTEMEIYKRLSVFPVPEKEQVLWSIEQKIHLYGIPVDRELVDAALFIREKSSDELMAEAIEITGLKNPNSRDQLKGWIEKTQGEELPNLTAATVEKLFQTTKDPSIKRVLEIRQELSKASIKKYDAFQNTICEDGRMRGAHQIYGANRTGRWAGRFIQPQNLPRNYIPALDLARDLIKQGKINHLKIIYGNLSDTLSQLIRTVIIASKDRKLIVADFSAIEARVLAWLAGEKWVMDVFASHGKIYEATASQMFGIPINKIVKGQPEYEYRRKGKIATLALGYQGSKGALITMGALEQGLSEEELPDIVNRWRDANPNIVNLWRDIEDATLNTMKTGQESKVKCLTIRREGEIVYGQDFLTIELPSGRKLYYVKPALIEGKYGNQQLAYYDAVSKGMKLTETYGGKLTENVVQAIARDCLAESLIRLYDQCDIIMHVHDEIVVDGSNDLSVDKLCDLMSKRIDWAPDLELAAAGFESPFYMKD